MKVARTVPRGGKPERAYLSQLGQQVNIRCKQYCLDKTIIKLMKKYLILDPKPSDLTMVRVIKARTGQLKGMSPFKALE